MADPNGLIARTLAAIRYAATGAQPTEWFGPGAPLADQAPPAVQGRQFDYPAFVNINYRPRNTEQVGFEKLKLLAATCEPLKLVMGRQRDLIKELDWSIKPRKRATGTKPDDAAIGAITDVLEQPDREHDWAQWIGAVLDQLFVLDAVSIYARPTLGGALYALELIDGATITPLVDVGGRRPSAPAPAYKQVLKGLPATSYSDAELTYFPENYRADHIYGWSRVEQIIGTAEMTIERMKSQTGYFTHGNTGDGYFTAPLNFSPEQVRSVEASWNAMMSGDGARRTADRRQSPFLPAGTEWHPTKVDLFQEMFDEWLIRLVCFPFGVSPTPFLKQSGLGHGSAKSDQEAAQEGGLAPVMQYVTRLMNRLIATRFGRADLEFAFNEDREFDPQVASEIVDQKIKSGRLTLDEARDADGQAPYSNGMGAQPLIYTASGAVRLADVIDPPPPPEPAAVPVPGAPTAPPAPANDDPAAKVPALAKAADRTAAAQKKLTRALAAYLAAKGTALTDALPAALRLTKAAMDDYSGRIDDAFEEVDWNWSDLAPVVEPLLGTIAVARGTDELTELALFDKPTLAKLYANVTDYAENRAAEMVGMKRVDGELVENPDADWSIPDATRTMLRAAVAEALESGDSTASLADTIRAATAFSEDRADTIARTETAKAQINGAVAGWKASGLVAGKQFDASPDCCDECQSYDGEVVALDEDFSFGPDLPHPACRCSVSPVLPEDMPDDASGSDDGDVE